MTNGRPPPQGAAPPRASGGAPESAPESARGGAPESARGGAPGGALAAEGATRPGLARRIAGFAAAVVLMTALSVSATHLALEHAGARAGRVDLVQAEIAQAAETIRRAIGAGDMAALHVHLESLAGGAGAGRALVYDDAGRLVAGRDAGGRVHQGPAPDDLAARARMTGQTVSSLRDGVLSMAVPVGTPEDFPTAPERVGRDTPGATVAGPHAAASAAGDRGQGQPGVAVLRVDAPLTVAVAPLLVAALAPIGVGLLTGWLGIALLLAFVRRLTQPLRVLAQLARDGDLSKFSPGPGFRTGDEIEALAAAFSRLVRRIQSDMRRLQQVAYFDPVTQLANRDRLRAEIGAALRQVAARPGQGALVVVEISRFARVNETLGRARADELLQALAGRLAAAVEVADRMLRIQTSAANRSLLAHTGSDQFTIHIPDIADAAQAGRFAQLVSGAMRQPVEAVGHRLYFSLTCGVSVYPADGAETETLLRNAHLALAAAKAEGEGQVRFFTPALDERAQARLQLETELREALEHGQLVAHFQPKVDLTSDRIVSCEALARWTHPRHGVLAPSRFIEAAEQLGLMSMVGEEMLQAAAAAATRWVRRGHRVRVAVNVSMSQFADDRFADRVLAILERTGLPCDLLELEITESVAMDNPERVSALLAPLRKRGVRLAIDDFGAGHSSLAALTRLPFDVFKIDQQFVHALEEDPNAPAVIDTVLALARALSYETVAEGVETPAQAAFLRRRGCTLAQGYLFGTPMPETEFAALLDARHPARTKAAGL